MTISLIIATYNWPGALRLSILSALNQTRLPNEIIIADDGSGPETKQLIDELREVSTIPIIHVWQIDNGFRLAEIRNKAFVESNCDYLIQIDGDIVLDKRFIEDHEKFARPGTFVVGSRCMVQKNKTDELIKQRIINLHFFTKGVRSSLNGLHIPWLTTRLSRYKETDIYAARGCNMAFWRSDIFEVNGYNENFKGWGREDTELTLRLMNKGLHKRFIKFGGIIYHLHHNVRMNEEELQLNHKLLLAVQTKKEFRCDKGIKQHEKQNLDESINIQTDKY